MEGKKESLKLPEGVTVQVKHCLVNMAGVTIREFDTPEELDEYLRLIQPHVDKVQAQKIHKHQL